MPPDSKDPEKKKNRLKRWLLISAIALIVIGLSVSGVFLFQLRKAEEQKESLDLLWANGRYDEGIAYISRLKTFGITDQLRHFYRACFLAGVNRLEEAKKELSEAGEIPESSREISQLQSEIAHRHASGQFTLLYDRKNLPLVSKSLNGDIKIFYDSIRTILQNKSGSFLTQFNHQPNDQAVLTIDYRIQTEAIKALGNYAGAIVVMNPQNGEILAAASNLKGVGSAYPDDTSLAFDHEYEPGSIIKMITFAGALEKKANPQKLFPMKCEGSLMFADHQMFYDWEVHNDLKDIETAAAVSCNVGFAKMGLIMKPADLLGNLKTFGFDDRLPNAFLPLELGKIKKAELNEMVLADLSIGLDYLEMTPLHIAMVASAIANGGVCNTPKLLLHHRNVIGVPHSPEPTIPYRRFMSPQTANLVTKAMEYVVQYEDGTGRRAQIADFPLAIKTGTAGHFATGYNAIIMGFAPSKKPKIAFAIVAEHSGKAEFEAARITKSFLESIRGYIR
jgi:peptidoglycan glycosyltransferase